MAQTKLKPQSNYEGHGDTTNAPSPRKGKFKAVGTYLDSGEFKTTFPKATSVNVKTGTSSGMEQ